MSLHQSCWFQRLHLLQLIQKAVAIVSSMSVHTLQRHAIPSLIALLALRADLRYKKQFILVISGFSDDNLLWRSGGSRHLETEVQAGSVA